MDSSDENQVMNSSDDFSKEFIRADTNHDGIIDEREFRSFLGPVIQLQKNQSPQFTNEDIQAFNSTPVVQTLIYEIGLDVAVCGFIDDPIKFESYVTGNDNTNNHSYGLGPDVGIGAPDIAPKLIQYDAAGAMFNYADVNHDMKIDPTEFNYLMRSI
ncbi:unnamed protein product [Adineta steineri]|uniref:EF-hand domain-containing protein n=1 Tax=Adineta steineri TaxID=433720 RepID=A0A814DBC9_9BILA|nr:unnamed protein product [Adineta steineri]CAF1191455.1 unnamed protein product [Adineta steineri]CAF1191819.1 unnamed protein product [Adineta steineri]CAF1245636.1 unnamed protein product [Adineta steineri]CAF1300317.1 unnamed protein product [Adineta steineri]